MQPMARPLSRSPRWSLAVASLRVVLRLLTSTLSHCVIAFQRQAAGGCRQDDPPKGDCVFARARRWTTDKDEGRGGNRRTLVFFLILPSLPLFPPQETPRPAACCLIGRPKAATHDEQTTKNSRWLKCRRARDGNRSGLT